jgi:hypothetical protein
MNLQLSINDNSRGSSLILADGLRCWQARTGLEEKMKLAKSAYHPPGHPLRGHPSRAYPAGPNSMNWDHAAVLFERFEDMSSQEQEELLGHWAKLGLRNGYNDVLVFWRLLKRIDEEFERRLERHGLSSHLDDRASATGAALDAPAQVGPPGGD